MEKPKIFVSSTVNDLKEERQKVVKELGGMFDIFLSENESAHSMPPIDVCMEEVEKCDLFILIIGGRYGFVPEMVEGTPYDGKISVTHGEFEKAMELRKPILVFVKEMATGREKKETAFLEELGKFLEGSFYRTFTDFDSFNNDLKISISNLLVNLIRYKYVRPWRQKPNVIIAKNADNAKLIVARILGHAIRSHRYPNIGLSAGKTMSDVYLKFFDEFTAEKMGNITKAQFFSVTEHFGISPKNKSSYRFWFNQAFFNKIKKHWKIEIPEDNIRLVPSTIEEGSISDFFKSYDQLLQIYKVAVQIISPAPSGQIISIDPGICSLEEMRNMGTGLVEYSEDTKNYLVPASPSYSDIVIGIKNMLTRSQRLVVIACGENKREVTRRMLVGEVGNNYPASLMYEYPNFSKLLFVIDLESASSLPLKKEKYINQLGEDQWSVLWDNGNH